MFYFAGSFLVAILVRNLKKTDQLTKKSSFNVKFGKSFKSQYEFSYDNNDYVIWAACGLKFGGKQLARSLARVSCQRLQNVSLSIRWVGKKAPGSLSTRYKFYLNYVYYLIHLIVALVALFIHSSL